LHLHCRVNLLSGKILFAFLCFGLLAGCHIVVYMLLIGFNRRATSAGIRFNAYFPQFVTVLCEKYAYRFQENSV
jgi:hypothetical protein